MMLYFVYKHTFPNGKIYIGITDQKPERRWRNGIGYRRQPYVYNAIRKYKWANVKHEILFSGLSKEEAENKELELIAKYKSNQKTFGYNIANGGNSTGTVSEETKKKISDSLKGRPKEKPPWKGKHHSAETKAKLSSLRKGDKNPMYGRRASDYTKEKMSASHKDCSLCKQVICIETGETFKSASDASRKMNLSQGNVSSVARGVREHTKGYHFKYVTKEVTH